MTASEVANTTIDGHVRWSNSTLNALRTCERKFAYRWVDGLIPSHGSYAMERGSWFHHCLAAHHIAKGLREGTLLIVPGEIDLRIPGMEPVRIIPKGEYLAVAISDTDDVVYPLSAAGMLTLLTREIWDTMPAEVRDDLDGDLPAEVRDLLERYFFHHRADEYDVLLVEQEWERDGFVGAIDLVKYDRTFNLVTCVDHKTHANLPDAIYRLTDAQLHLYAWGLEPLLAEHGRGVDAVEFDYVVTRSPAQVKWTKPTKKNPASRLYATVKAGSIDLLTLKRGIAAERERIAALPEDEQYPLDEEAIAKVIEKVAEGDNPYFKRSLMPTHDAVIEALLEEHQITRERGREILSGRLPVRSTDWFKCRQCPYADLCAGDLYMNDTTPLLAGFTKEESD